MCLQCKDFSLNSSDGDNNKELRRLQFFGAGPKMAGYNQKVKEDKTRGKKANYDYDPVSLIAFLTKVKPKQTSFLFSKLKTLYLFIYLLPFN